jgi:hypothetical protein
MDPSYCLPGNSARVVRVEAVEIDLVAGRFVQLVNVVVEIADQLSGTHHQPVSGNRLKTARCTR